MTPITTKRGSMKTQSFQVDIKEHGSMPNAENIVEAIIYVKILEGKPYAALFLCPCGCMQQVYLPVGYGMEGGSDSPREIEIHNDGTISISPSIEMTGGCRSHYHIKHNKVTN